MKEEEIAFSGGFEEKKLYEIFSEETVFLGRFEEKFIFLDYFE